MAAQVVKKKGEGEDILGLLAFGSLITNISQLVSKKTLEKQHEALKAYATELKTHYNNMKVREKQVYSKYLELKKANEELIALNDRLIKELISIKDENLKLKSAGLQRVFRRRKNMEVKNK